MSGRREVLDDARRRVERALASEGAAEELAAAAEALLQADPADNTPAREGLRAALGRYRKLRGLS